MRAAIDKLQTQNDGELGIALANAVKKTKDHINELAGHAELLKTSETGGTGSIAQLEENNSGSKGRRGESVDYGAATMGMQKSAEPSLELSPGIVSRHEAMVVPNCTR